MVTDSFPRCSSSLPDADTAPVKPDPDTCFSPNLTGLIKKEPHDALNLIFDASDTLRRAPVGTKKIQEGGNEVFIILDSDDEEEQEEDTVLLAIHGDLDDGMSSDTAVGDIGGFDLEDDDGHGAKEVNSPDSDADAMSELEFEPLQTPSLWLDDGLVSRLSNEPCKVTRQRQVERVEYLNDIPSYWPIPEVYVAYVLDLSDPKFDIKDKDGKLLPVDTLICDKVSEFPLIPGPLLTNKLITFPGSRFLERWFRVLGFQTVCEHIW